MAPTLVIRVHLLLGWNTYLLFNSDVANIVWKIDEGEAESIVLLIFVLWRCFNGQWMRGAGVGVESCINRIFLRFIFMSYCCFRFSSLGNL